MPVIGRGDKGAEPDAARHARGCRKRGNGGVPLLVSERSPRQVVVNPRVIEAEFFSLNPAMLGFSPRLLGEYDDSVSHVLTLLGASVGGVGSLADERHLKLV